MNYYNEWDKYAARWLQNLIDAGHIPPGVVDTRSIEDVRPSDLDGFTQCHFFAGLGGWSYALQLAGWPDDRPVWTGSCPCQPFSAAGKGTGFTDERHLWPAFFHLISQCRPAAVFGEQVASVDGLAWLDLVQADLEGARYANAAFDLCAASVGAPHIRQRLYWPGHCNDTRLEGWERMPERADEFVAGTESVVGSVADTDGQQHDRIGQLGPGWWPEHSNGSTAIRMADIESGRWEQQRTKPSGCNERSPASVLDQRFGSGGIFSGDRSPGPVNGFWRDSDWLFCRDGKWRPVEPGTFPLAHGVSQRVGQLRAYGNAIVPQVAAELIRAYMLDTSA